jgi:hypothetical protein
MNRIQYGTLRINYAAYVDNTIKMLNSSETDSLNILSELIRKGVITIKNNCE